MSSSFNGLRFAEAESLALLAEEGAEIVQAVTKALRHGLDSEHPDTGEVNRDAIAKECGDALAAMDIAVHNGLIDWDAIDAHRRMKLIRVKDYLHHAKVPK